MSERVYLDWNATSPLRREARDAMGAALDLVGNPSSVHGEGRAVRRLVEEAREKVATVVGADPSHVVFTSGGTEANILALTPAIDNGGKSKLRERLLVSAIEHPSVRGGGRFAAKQVEEIPMTRDGVVDLAALKDLLARGGSALVSVMLANNETGIIQPIREIADLVHEAGDLLHVDAVQGPGRIPIDINTLGADLLTLSAHKLGGPKGCGALVTREGIHIAEPLIRGGGQERGARGGTENVAGIAGFGAAAETVVQRSAEEAAHVRALQSALEQGLKAVTPEAIIFGEGQKRLPNTTLFTARGLKAETAVIAFDLDGVAVSSGAACSSGKVQASHVLAAMGVEGALAHGAIRVSLGYASTQTDVEKVLKSWKKLSESLLKGRHVIAA